MRDILEDAEGAADRGDIGPGKANRGQDKPKFPKRFYKKVALEETGNGFSVKLDDRSVKTPGRQELCLPNEASAELVAEEWRSVEKEINPLKMPVTRLANTTQDGVATEMQAVMEDIVRYASSDLLCYRASNPWELVEIQRQHWDPVLDWAAAEFGANFETGEGVAPLSQPRTAIHAYAKHLERHAEPIKLTCFHTFTSLTGSAILALALAEGEVTVEQTWAAAHVDEDWNTSLWGEDYEAAERRKQRWTDFEAAHRLFASVFRIGTPE